MISFSFVLHSTYGTGASSTCPESNWLRALDHSNCVAGDRQGCLKPGEMVLYSSWKNLRVGVLDNSWPVSHNLSYFIHQNVFSLHSVSVDQQWKADCQLGL